MSSVDAFKKLVGGDDEYGKEITSEMVAAAVAEENADKLKRATTALKGVLTVGNDARTAAVANLRKIREQERTAKKKVDDLNNAIKFFAATGNPFPVYAAVYGQSSHYVSSLCERMGIAIPDKDNAAWRVDQE